eukprot:COSAG02_NODE_8571_length_2520_cov_3.141264_2_plen_744_part_01
MASGEGDGANIGRTLYFLSSGDKNTVSGISADGSAWMLENGRVAKKSGENHAWKWAAPEPVRAHTTSSAPIASPAQVASIRSTGAPSFSSPPRTPPATTTTTSVVSPPQTNLQVPAAATKLAAKQMAHHQRMAATASLAATAHKSARCSALRQPTPTDQGARLRRQVSAPTIIREWVESPSKDAARTLNPSTKDPKPCRFDWKCNRDNCYFSHPNGRKIDGDPEHARFTVLSYNLQAAGTREHFDATDLSAVDECIVEMFEVGNTKIPDVISLQELQRCPKSVEGYCPNCDAGRCKYNHADYVKSMMEKRGYAGHIHEAGDMVNTVGLFWNKKAFRMQTVACDNHSTATLPTRKGALYAQLLHTRSNETIGLVALHPSVPMDGEQTPNTGKPMSEVTQIMKKTVELFEPMVPCILAGDFNSVPVPTARCAPPDVYEYVVGQGYSSAYKTVQGCEPEFTSVRPTFQHCIDYIFLKSGSNVAVSNVLGIRASKAGRITEPSDHVPIMAEFKVLVDRTKKPTPRQAWGSMPSTTEQTAPNDQERPNVKLARQLSETKDRVEIDVGGKQLILCVGDLTTFAGDAIVNAANEAMLGGGGVDGAIHAAAGQSLLTECRKVPQVSVGVRCPTGEARMTKAAVPDRFGRLQTDCVIHTVGPRGTDAKRDELLAAAYTNSIRLANEAGLRSIAFPSISTGIYGFPIGAAAAIAMDVCEQSLQSDDTSLETIQFFFSNQAALDQYRSATQGALV